ncbi:hypothetical protein BASA81_004872 [Batrachochytrium salamandrivorans]|nr:hypothetical protein BASA81_004872 [Batrachochytrium salamandrivorans]
MLAGRLVSQIQSRPRFVALALFLLVAIVFRIGSSVPTISTLPSASTMSPTPITAHHRERVGKTPRPSLSAFEEDEEDEADDDYDEEVETSNDDSSEEEEGDKSMDHKNKGLKWFSNDPEGMHPEAVNSIWAKEISLQVNASRSSFERRNPQLVFIKTLKVGGTTVAIALDNAAKRYRIPTYRIREADNRTPKLSRMGCTYQASLYFHHGYRNPWMTECMPNVRFTTLLREPISQALSWEVFLLSKSYYHRYPNRDCAEDQIPKLVTDRDYTYAELQHMLRQVQFCRSTAVRKEITLRLLAYRVARFGHGPGSAVQMSTSWILGGRLTRASNVMVTLRDEYFLVGVTPMVNEFLLLLALHMGWDPTALYYVHCKPTDLDVHSGEFKERFPALYSGLEVALAKPTKVYETMRKDFIDKLAELRQVFPEFDALLIQFQTGLAAYQKKRSGDSLPYPWKRYKYGDGHFEYC